MPTPGIGDPYWFEWYVGLKHIVEMLNPDNGIESVIFQHPEYDTIDDVVVEYKDDKKQICYQIKHEISTSIKHNLTFGKLFETDPDRPSKKCLLSAIMCGWDDATNSGANSIKPILYTNRTLGTNRRQRTYNGETYSAYPIGKFFELLSKNLSTVKDGDVPQFSDKNLYLQWEEMCDLLKISDVKKAVPFFKDFSIKGNQYGLEDIEKSLISTIATYFSCDEILANELFGRLVSALRKWTTSLREDKRVTIEDVYSALNVEGDINDSQHRLAPPYPFFESRQNFCKELEKLFNETTKNVVFISGDPGSGKTSIISYLQSSSNFFTLRYHTFRPISPEQHFYNIDAGMYSNENLWGTFLIQLRQKFIGKLAKYDVPVSNKLLTVEKMRDNVLRLLGILAIEAKKQNKRIYVCIDGIDHAARAKSDISFLSSLPTPDELPEGVCFIIVGQPSHMYQTQYPVWLSNNQNVEYINMPKLCPNDIKQLILEKAPLLQENADGLADFIYQCTDGNNLSTVFAVEEIKNESIVDGAITRLKTCGITSNVQQYYTHIWNHMKMEIRNMNVPGICPESIVACPILLMNGRVKTGILARALPYNISESEWKMILNKLHPLIVRGNKDGEYSVFHNDFRVFLMNIISGYIERYEEIALALAEDLLHNEEGLLSYVMGIPLLQCANRNDLIPKYFNTGFIINALAEGISKQRLDEFAHLAYEASCLNHDMEGLINTYLAIKSLYQHTRYYEYYQKEYHTDDYPEISFMDISEIRALSISKENLDEYRKVLSLCKKLYKTGTTQCMSRLASLYQKWFEGLTPYSFLPICIDEVTEEEYWHLNSNEVGFFLQEWGKIAAEINAELPCIDEPNTKLQWFASTIIGKEYFEKCVEINNINLAIDALEKGYVTESCFSDSLEKIFYNGNTDKVKHYLSKISVNEEKPSIKLLATSMLVTYDKESKFDIASIIAKAPIKHVYDESSFAIVLRAFLIGHSERTLDDIVICGHAKDCYCQLEEKEPHLSQISQLVIFSCLLGKYYWDDKASQSETFTRLVKWYLSTELYRSFDYSKAKKFLLLSLLQSRAGKSLAETEYFFNYLKNYLFKIGSLGMYYKAYILDYLKEHNKLDIIDEYIVSLYGDNCSEISLVEEKVEMHNNFMPYGMLVRPDMMKKFSSQIKWDVIGYINHKEYAMEGPFNCFELITSYNPCLWKNDGLRLYKQSKIAEISGNRYAYDIRNSLIKSATKCGFKEFWELQSWDDEFRLNSDSIYHSIFDFIENSKDSATLEAIWLLCIGINSWYTKEERQKVLSVYNQCLEKGREFNCDFEEMVSIITPHWLTIINYETTKNSLYSKDEEYLKDREKAINDIETEYENLTIEELSAILSNIPVSTHPEIRLKIFIKKAKAKKAFTEDLTNSLINCVCSYLIGKEWSYYQLDEILEHLLTTMQEKAFWTLADTMRNNLSDYDYQTSMHNIQLLLKIYYQNNADELRVLFDKELETQELWVSGNRHIAANYNINFLYERFSIPDSFAEMVLYILVEQITTQNARRIKTALFAIQILGKEFSIVRDRIASEWDNFSGVQKDFLLLLIMRWAYDKIDLEKLINVLVAEYRECDLLSRKYYIHSILSFAGVEGIDENLISCDTEPLSYSLPKVGATTKDSLFEGFLYITEQYQSPEICEGIRKYIVASSQKDIYIDCPYDKNNIDIRIPTPNPKIDKILYNEEKRGRWNTIPITVKKSGLLSTEDPFILTEMPQIVYDEEWFPIVNTTKYIPNHEQLIDKKQFSVIVNKNVCTNEIMLSACIWYPWGHNDGSIYRESAIVYQNTNLLYNDKIDWCLGNLGLLAHEGDLYELKDSYEGINLFNRTARDRIPFGNSQMVPSSAWRWLLNCSPSNISPYIWKNEFGENILRFECISSPFREEMHELYIRQPILFRWVCNKEWLDKKLEFMRLRIRHISSIDEYPR